MQGSRLGNMAAKKTKITHLQHGGGEWILFSRSNPDVIAQAVYREDGDFPLEWCKECIDSGKIITHVSHGEGKWVVIADTPKKELKDKVKALEQEVSANQGVPKEKIEKAWTKGHRISFLAYCHGHWILITQKAPTYPVGQHLHVEKDVPREAIKKFWDQDCRIHILTFGEGCWVLVTEKVADPGAQTYFLSSEFPAKKIAQYYDTNKQISYIYYAGGNERCWVLIADPSTGLHPQVMEGYTKFPEDRLFEMKIFLFGANKTP